MVAFGQGANEIVGKGGGGSGLNLSVTGAWLAVADVFERAVGENNRILRHDANALAQVLEAELGRGKTIEQYAPRRRIVKAQQQLKHRTFARPAGPDDGHGLPRLDDQRKVQQCGLIRARGVVKADRLKGHRTAPAGHCTERWCGRRLDGRVAAQQLHQAFGGAGGAQQVAIDLAQNRKGTGQNNHIHHGLPQVARADAPGHHRLRALVEPPQQGGRGGDDDEGHQHRAGPRAPNSGFKGAVGRGIEASGFPCFGGIALHHRDGVEHLGCNGA